MAAGVEFLKFIWTRRRCGVGTLIHVPIEDKQNYVPITNKADLFFYLVLYKVSK